MTTKRTMNDRRKRPNNRPYIRPRRILHQAEIERIIAAARPKIRPGIMAMSTMGLRVGELSIACWHQSRRRYGRWEIAIPSMKSSKVEWRAVPNSLWNWISQRTATKRSTMFQTSPPSFRRLFRAACVSAGLSGVRTHDLRRFWLASRFGWR